MAENKTPRITYKDIYDFREKLFDELTEIRQLHTDAVATVMEEISEIKIEIKGQDEKFKGLIRRDTIGYAVDSLVAGIAIWLGTKHQ